MYSELRKALNQINQVAPLKRAERQVIMKNFEMEVMFAVKDLINEGRLSYESSDSDNYHYIAFSMDTLEQAEEWGKKIFAIGRVATCFEEHATTSIEIYNGFCEKLNFRKERHPDYWGRYCRAWEKNWKETPYDYEQVTVHVRAGGAMYTFKFDV